MQANNGNEVTIGPFEWTPNVNAYGHDCLLAIVTADGDPSNIDNLEPGQTFQEWRLIPHDNNVGQPMSLLYQAVEAVKHCQRISKVLSFLLVTISTSPRIWKFK